MSLEAEKILRRFWGYSQFRPLQKEVINAAVSGNDTLVLFPTGGGKSICYQVAGLLRGGCTLVISPLISLMQDQVAGLKQKGLRAEALVSGMRPATIKRLMMNAVHGGCEFLYVSPERLQSSWFREHLRAMPINLIAVDEAHCISQWGNDFRPDYLKISELREVFPRVPVMALTATATPLVAKDISEKLLFPEDAKTFSQSFSRPNLFWEVKETASKEQAVISLLKQEAGSVIIYCRSRKHTEQLTKTLNGENIPALHYHAGMKREARDEAFDKWMKNESRVMVATTAFGMGIDKADVRLVIHYDVPESPEAYYQEAGRAGRDGKPAKAIILYQRSDLRKLNETVAEQYPETDFLRQVYQSVCEYLQLPIGNEPYQYFPFDLAELCKNFKLPLIPAGSAMRLLAREGYWTLCDGFFEQETIQVVVDRHVIDDLADSSPQIYEAAVALLRLYSGLYQHPVTIRLLVIAQKLKKKKDEVVRLLEIMEQMELIEWTRPLKGSQLFVHHRRSDSRYIIIDEKRIGALRKATEERVAAMLNYVTAREGCRNRILLGYFGEAEKADCGHCDHCLSKSATKNTGAFKKELWLVLEHQPAISLQDICLQLPVVSKEALTETIRQWRDEGLVAVDHKQRVSII